MRLKIGRNPRLDNSKSFGFTSYGVQHIEDIPATAFGVIPSRLYRKFEPTSGPVLPLKRISHGMARASILVIDANDDLWAIGDNTYGQLSIVGTSADEWVKVGTKKWKDVAIGSYHSLAIDTDGNLFATGNNQYGRTGLGTTTGTTLEFTQVGDKAWKQCSAGNFHSAAIDDLDQLHFAGRNATGATSQGTNVGDVSTFSLHVFSQYDDTIGSNARFKYVSCGDEQSIAVDMWDRGWFGGQSNGGRIGTNTTNLAFTKLTGGEKWWGFHRLKSVVCGYSCTFWIDENDRVYSSGSNTWNAMGLKEITGNGLVDITSVFPEKIVKLAPGRYVAGWVGESGSLYMAGRHDDFFDGPRFNSLAVYSDRAQKNTDIPVANIAVGDATYLVELGQPPSSPSMSTKDTADHAEMSAVYGDITNFTLDGTVYDVGSGSTLAMADFPKTSGKYYFEMWGTPSQAAKIQLGVCIGDYTFTSPQRPASSTGFLGIGGGSSSTSWYYNNSGATYTAGEGVTLNSSLKRYALWGFALDLDTRVLQIYKDGFLMGTFADLPAGNYRPYVYTDNYPSRIFTNFGDMPYLYHPPAGFTGWSKL